jgi:hypothetical protein
VIGTILTEDSANPTIMRDCLPFLLSCPKNLHRFFAEPRHLDVYMKMFTLGFDEGETNELFGFLYTIMPQKGPQLDYFKDTSILEYALTWRKPNAMMLMTKLTTVVDIATRVRQSEAIDWCFDLLANRETVPLLLEAVMIVLTNICHLPDPAALPPLLAWPAPRLSQRLFETTVPIVLSCHKMHVDLAARAFQLFAECVPHAKQAVADTKVIQLASVLLITNMKRIEFVFVLLSFLWACATSGLIPQLKAVNKVLPNVMKVLDMYVTEKQIVERCVGFAFLMDHPKRIEQLQLAIRNYPDSAFLKGLCSRDEIDALVRHRLQKLT